MLQYGCKRDMAKCNKIRTIVCISCNTEVTKRMPAGRKYCSLKCYRESKRPQRKTGEIIVCVSCQKEMYKPKCELKENNFCSKECADEYSGINKLVYNCKTCGIEFKWSRSRALQANPKYCSMDCRNKDEDHMAVTGMKARMACINKKGLNKLELKGNEILDTIGVRYENQVPMFNKFTVDVLVESSKLVIQWDGVYWHTMEHRKRLDDSQDAYLNKCGYRVLRITDTQIKEDLDFVYFNIRAAI